MRLTHLQALRGVACLLVLLFHAAEWELRRCDRPTIQYAAAFEHFGYAGVDLFFVLSGFVITSVSFSKLGQPRYLFDFVWRRFWRIYPLYWACWIAVILAYVNLVGIPWAPTLRWLIGNALILPSQPQHLFIPQAWSLAFELLFYGTFAAFFLLPRKAFLPCLAGWSVLIATVGFIDAPKIPLPGPIARNLQHLVDPLVLEFLLGCGAAYAVRRGIGMTLWRPAIVLGALGFAFAGVADFAGWLNVKDHTFARAGLFGTASALVVFGATSAERRLGPVSPRWLQRIGDASYSIYLVHVGVLEVVHAWIGKISHAPAPHAAYVAALIAASLAVGTCMHVWVERPLINLARRPQQMAQPIKSSRRAA